MFNIKDIIPITLILFSIIDILGSIPIILDLKQKGKKIHSGQATILAGILMIVFLVFGESLLAIFGVDVKSFSIAGGLIMFFMGIEMTLGIVLFKEVDSKETNALIPLVFPLLIGAGTMTSIISLKSQYAMIDILISIIINLMVIFVVLKSSNFIGKTIGKSGMNVIRKVFGIILLAISIKIIKQSLISDLGKAIMMNIQN